MGCSRGIVEYHILIAFIVCLHKFGGAGVGARVTAPVRIHNDQYTSARSWTIAGAVDSYESININRDTMQPDRKAIIALARQITDLLELSPLSYLHIKRRLRTDDPTLCSALSHLEGNEEVFTDPQDGLYHVVQREWLFRIWKTSLLVLVNHETTQTTGIYTCLHFEERIQ